MSRPRTSHSRCTALLAALAVVGVACSSSGTEAGPWGDEGFDVVDARIVDPDRELELHRTLISPSGRLAAVQHIDEVCIEPIVDPDSDDAFCFDIDSDIRPDFESLNWSSDETQLVVVGPTFLTGNDPDISTIDLSNEGELEVLTDDGVDDFAEGDFDVAPFFGPDDDVYFLRLDRDDDAYVLHRIDDGGDAVSIDDVRFPDDVVPAADSHQLTDNRVAIYWAGGVEGNGMSVIDVNDETIEHIELNDDVFDFVGATGRYAIVGDLSTQGIRPEPFQLVDLETGRSRRVEAGLGINENMTAVALAPSGDAIVALVSSSFGEKRFVALPVSNGRIDDPIEVVDVADFDEFDAFDDVEDVQDLVVRGVGPNRFNLMINSSGHLVFAADDRIAVLTVAGR